MKKMKCENPEHAGQIMIECPNTIFHIYVNNEHELSKIEVFMENINLLEGKLVAPAGMKFGIIATRFNEIIVNKLLGGAVDGLVRHGVEDKNITAVWVPGAFEIPVIADKMAASGKYDAVIAVGAVIRGSTTHYDYVCAEVSKGIAQASMKNGVPVMFGVITTENIEQAIERAGSKAGNKGYDCAVGAIEMVNLIKQL